MNFKTLFAIIIIVCFSFAISYGNNQIKEQKNKLEELKVRIDKIEIEQKELWLQVEAYQNKPVGVEGKASWYDYALDSGWSSKGHYVCASRDYPRKSVLIVTNLDNGKSIDCVVTDFGPNKVIHPDRIIDLSSASFEAISELHRGVINVKVQQVKYE